MTELLGVLATALLGTAGFAGLFGAVQQVTRTARLRAAVAKNVELAKMFDPASAPARACMLVARDASLELCARSSVTFAPLGLVMALLAALLAAMQVAAFAARLWAVAGDPSAPIIDFSDAMSDEIMSPAVVPADLKLWVLYGTALLLLLVARAPWYRLSRERRRFVARLRSSDDLLASAEHRDVRVEVYPWQVFQSLRDRTERKRHRDSRSRAQGVTSGDPVAVNSPPKATKYATVRNLGDSGPQSRS
ncbi:hypothetical protein ACFWE5_07370 [Cellulosimicrobium funkei]|uniref:hypothetical protein n=1 Tax=Cellulosimicrobium funkei TaxID=264251 RepID=UPI00365CE142